MIGNENKKLYLGIFQIGPVQEFIKQSRKTRDLWASSYLLSYLIQNAIEKVGNDKLIYPSPNHYSDLKDQLFNNQKIPVFPNRFLVIHNNEIVLIEKFKDAENEIKNIFEDSKGYKFKYFEVLDEFKNIKKNGTQLIDTQKFNDLLKRQLNNLFEVYWVIVPLDNDYNSSYKKAELIFNARKSIRNFTQIEENGFKCTVCGEREPISNDSLDRNKIKEEWKEISKIFGYKFKENEHLCSVCSLKRLFREDIKFPSTSTIAVSSFLDYLIDNLITDNDLINLFKKFYENLKSEIKTTVNCNILTLIQNTLFEPTKSMLMPKIENKLNEAEVIKNKIDKEILELFELEGLIFYEETYSKLEKKLEEFKTSNTDFLEDLKNKIEEIKKCLEEFKKKKNISKYFAVIKYDGDNIGVKLGQQNSPEEHKIFSEKISSFSEFVAEKQKEFLFIPVYAGGDEGLILCSLSDSLKIVNLFNEEFKSKNLTLSFSLVIAHYRYPLSVIIEKSTELLKAVKDFDSLGKNCFGINLLKRSGEDLVLITSLKRYNSEDILNYFKDIINCYISKDISKRWWRSIVDEKNSYQYKNGNDEIYLDKDLLKLETKRLIKRKLSNKSSNFSSIVEKFINLPLVNDIEFFIKFMSICEFMARED